MTNLIVIADIAGRMNELGKNHLMDYLLHTTAHVFQQERYSDIKPFFFSWNSEINQLEEPFSVDCCGKSDINMLEDMLQKLDKSSFVLILSDGNFDYFPIKKIILANELNVIGIIVGADASVSAMNAITSIGKAQHADCIMAAIAKISGFISEEE